MPPPIQIRAAWAPWLVDEAQKFDSVVEVMEDDYCFACGMLDDWGKDVGSPSKTERAHIQARVLGGSDDIDNLHLLCSICHKDSELLDGEAYDVWFQERTMVSVCLSIHVRHGKNLGPLLAGHTPKAIHEYF